MTTKKEYTTVMVDKALYKKFCKSLEESNKQNGEKVSKTKVVERAMRNVIAQYPTEERVEN